nr:GNAT family N-acetyltransferase [Marinobacter salinus]
MSRSLIKQRGWGLSLAHWGKGYASEAARGALHVGFQQLRLPEPAGVAGHFFHRCAAPKLPQSSAPGGKETPWIRQNIGTR